MSTKKRTRRTDDDQHEDAIDSEPDRYGDLGTLESLDRDDVTWYVYRLAPDGRALPTGVRQGDGLYVLKFTGTFSLDRLREELGGGFYRVIGKSADSGEFVVRARFGIDAPLRSALFAPAGVATTTPVVSPASEELQRVLRELAELRLQVSAQPREPKPTPINELLQGLVTLDQLRGAPSAASGPAIGIPVADAARQISDAFNAGREVGRTESTPEDRNGWPAVVREVVPEVLNTLRGFRPVRTLAVGGAARATAPASAPAAAPEAEVVVSPVSGNAVLLELLARAVANGSEPEDLADLAETVLSDRELEQLRSAPDDGVLALVASDGGSYPVLVSRRSDDRLEVRPEVQIYVRSFLSALRRPPESDPGAAS